ncbi:MAG: hypothetical protein R3252_11695 [Robiginitalea sp.]|nr:hypothetical protein [Robiginitalea sp.]
MKIQYLICVPLVFLLPLLHSGCSDEIDPDPFGITVDTDGDGVADISDRCPETPAGADTDDFGCPVGSEYTYVPDDAFEQILINNELDDTLDDYVLTESIRALTELYLNSSENLNITDFTGIEGFESLGSLYINLMSLSGVTLDLSQNSPLRQLSFACDDIADLTIISPNIETLSILGISDLCPMWRNVSGLDLTGLPNLKNLHLSGVTFSDLNATLNTATSIETLWTENITGENGPLELLDLSPNNNLKLVTIWATNAEGPDKINLKNGANQLLGALRLGVNPAFEWQVCVEVDDPDYIESIISSAFGVPLPDYTVTQDCSN